MMPKAPTCVLLDSDENFKSFRYEAISEFQDDENAIENCYFFRNFKMKLYEQKAGIEDNQLTLALEPEAALLYCRRVPNSVVRHPGDGPSIANFQAGQLTAHEVLEDGHLKVIIEHTGGYWGGLRVNEEFTRFLQRLFGQDVLTELKENYPADWQAIADDFELKKCAYDPNGVMGKITIRIPLTLVEEYENTTGCSLREAISQTPFKDHLEFKQYKLRMDKAIFENFFEESITKVVSKVEKLLRENPQLHNLDTSLVVGGYAESPLKQQAIKDKFAGKYKIVIPSDPSLAIIKGAIMYGFELDAVKSCV